jgi:hypothetical protein
MISVSLATYLAVLNLRHILNAIYGKYLRWKNVLVDGMKNDKLEAWRVTAELLERFPTRNGRSESGPSEWWVAAYFVMRLMERVGLRSAGRDRQTV